MRLPEKNIRLNHRVWSSFNLLLELVLTPVSFALLSLRHELVLRQLLPSTCLSFALLSLALLSSTLLSFACCPQPCCPSPCMSFALRPHLLSLSPCCPYTFVVLQPCCLHPLQYASPCCPYNPMLSFAFVSPSPCCPSTLLYLINTLAVLRSLSFSLLEPHIRRDTSSVTGVDLVTYPGTILCHYGSVRICRPRMATTSTLSPDVQPAAATCVPSRLDPPVRRVRDEIISEGAGNRILQMNLACLFRQPFLFSTGN